VGISAYAAKQLGDVVFVELPEIGREMCKGDEAAVVESVKAASEVYAPIGGEVTEVNEALEDAPETVNPLAGEVGRAFYQKRGTRRGASKCEALFNAPPSVTA